MPGTFGQRSPGGSPSINAFNMPPFGPQTPTSIDTIFFTPPNRYALNGDYFSIPVSFDGHEDFRGRSDFVMELPKRLKKAATRNRSCESSPALIRIVPFEDLVRHTTTPGSIESPSIFVTESPPVSSQPSSTMAYNEHGELVNADVLLTPPTPSAMTAVEITRVIKKAYHHEVSQLYSCYRRLRCIFSQLGGVNHRYSLNLLDNRLIVWDCRGVKVVHTEGNG
jgi:hypothetical protein